MVARQRIEQTKYCRGTAQNPSAQQCSQTMCAGPSNDLFVLSLGLPLHGDEQKKMCMCGQKLFKNLQCILHLFRINVIICFKTNVHWWGLLHFTCNDVHLAFIQLRDMSYAGAPFYPLMLTSKNDKNPTLVWHSELAATAVGDWGKVLYIHGCLKERGGRGSRPLFCF